MRRLTKLTESTISQYNAAQVQANMAYLETLRAQDHATNALIQYASKLLKALNELYKEYRL